MHTQPTARFSTPNLRRSMGWTAFRLANAALAASARLLGKEVALGHIAGDLVDSMRQIPRSATHPVAR